MSTLILLDLFSFAHKRIHHEYLKDERPSARWVEARGLTSFESSIPSLGEDAFLVTDHWGNGHVHWPSELHQGAYRP